MNTVEKGDKLENALYQYLLDQKEDGYVFGVYRADLCEIHQQKKYYCDERKNYIKCDVVIEVKREGAETPHIIIIFECKNYSHNIPEIQITDFSDKLSRISKHGAKGFLVVTSRLQSGALNLVKNRDIGLMKYDEHGFEIVIERKSNSWSEQTSIEKQIFRSEAYSKPLKFSAYYDGRFFDSIEGLFRSIDSDNTGENQNFNQTGKTSIPYLTYEHIAQSANKLLQEVNYSEKAVNLGSICSFLSIDLKRINQTYQNEEGQEVLGFADFKKKEVHIYSHGHMYRERFTIAHEIGHFHLKHDNFLRSESVIENDLLVRNKDKKKLNYESLEFQANTFASCLLLPENVFRWKISELKQGLNMKDRGHGDIYVDDQRDNRNDYLSLLSELSAHFKVSKSAIEIKLKKMGMLHDNRKKNNGGVRSQRATILHIIITVIGLFTG